MSLNIINVNKTISFSYTYNLEINKKISWKVGIASSYWWQVKGCCKNIYESNGETCPPIKVKQECEGKSQYIQVILSSNLQELCKELKDSDWEWKICSIERWSRPAENEFVTSADECNILEKIDYKNIPECLELSTDHTVIEKIKFIEKTFYSKCVKSNCVGDIISYTGSGEITLRGEAEYPSKNLKILGQYLLNQKTEQKIKFVNNVEIKELIFSEKYTNEYIPNLNLVQVSCVNCGELPNILYIDNNLKNLNIMSSFLFENNYELDDEMPIRFNKTTGIWSSVVHFNSKINKEKWKVIYELGCGGEESSEFYYWKFSLLISKESEKDKKETKISLKIPSEFVCAYSRDYVFSFKYNSKNNYLFINYAAYGNDFYFNDGIGLFKSNYWRNNPEIVIKISKDKIKNRINKKIIYY